MKNLYVITHTESIHHVERKVGGWFDTGLTEYGKVQAVKVASALIDTYGINTPSITSSTFVVSRWIGLPAESAGLVNFRSSSGGITHLQQDDFWCNRGVRVLSDTSHLLVG